MTPNEQTIREMVASIKLLHAKHIPCDSVGAHTVRRIAKEVAEADDGKFVFLKEPNGLLVQRIR
jgi:hypothetical protein